MIAIVAMTPSRVIGHRNLIPWSLPEDFRWFKKTTLGHPVLMGRKTFESLGRPLPGRANLVVSRTCCFRGVEMVPSLARFDPDTYGQEVFVIGGAEIYRALLTRCRQLLVTHVKAEYPGDAFFPEFEHLFRPVEEIRDANEFRIVRYERTGTGSGNGG
jgi:dihydrofolate reductase